MQRKILRIDFATPAFLCNAEQRAQWRTPPIKALLRHWWRVLAWNDGIREIAELRRKEGRWFGVAADDGGESRQSQVRIRLAGAWNEGSSIDWPRMPRLHHPEVKVPVQPDLYLGFGPITTKARRTALLPDTSNELHVATPDDFPLADLAKLLAWFGTLGSRSRNGWGSLVIDGMAPPTADDTLLKRIARPLERCLEQDWPHALGRDDKGLLIWRTAPKTNWREAMQELARVKIAFRTQFKFDGGKPHRDFQARHLLAYPVTDVQMLALIEAIHIELKGAYGSPRMVRELRGRGFPASKERVERLMRENGIRARHKRRYQATTDSRHALPVAPNLLARDFTPEKPNQAWSADMTYIWADEGWLYLAVVLDLFNREIVGWSIKPRMTADIVMDALTMAWFRKKPAPGVIHHSDRGSQYASHAFQARLKEYGMVASMSRKGNCWDNAPTESFFNSLKNERVHGTRYSTRAAAEADLFDYIEPFYNRRRRHSTLGYASPVKFLEDWISTQHELKLAA